MSKKKTFAERWLEQTLDIMNHAVGSFKQKKSSPSSAKLSSRSPAPRVTLKRG